MLTHKIRIATVSFVAMMFGVAQILCICSAQAAPISTQIDMMQIASSDEHAHHDMAQHASHNGDASDRHENGHDNNGGDCGHCSSDLALVNSVDTGAAFKTVADSDDPAVVLSEVATLITPANLAPTVLDGLRWLDPPRTTLISQKILLLI